MGNHQRTRGAVTCIEFGEVQHPPTGSAIAGQAPVGYLCPMIDARDMEDKAQALRQLLQDKFGVRSRSLRQALKRAGRRLPRAMRRQGEVLVRAEQLAAIPKLARQMRAADVDAAYNSLTSHLEAIDVADRRKGWWLSLAGSVATNMLLVITAFLIWLWWRGYV